MATGLTQDLYWYAAGDLIRMRPLPQPGDPGSLHLGVTPPTCRTLDLFGNGAGPFLLAADQPGTRLELLPFGVIATSLGLLPTFLVPLIMFTHAVVRSLAPSSRRSP